MSVSICCVIALSLSAWVGGCKSPQPASAPSGQDQAKTLRIVSLAPSVTEMLFELGLEGSIVGATNYCDYPPAAKSIPRVGGLGSPNIEELIARKPNLVIATEFENKEMPATLRKLGIVVHEVRINSIADVMSAFEVIGQLTGRAAKAKEIAQRMQSQLDKAAGGYASVPVQKRPRVFVEISSSPLMTVGKASFVTDVIERAGGVNVAGDLDTAYPKVNAEKVIEWNPDVVLLGSMVPVGSGKGELAGRIGWAGIAAVKNGRVIDDLSPDLFLRPGPRLVQGAIELSKRLYPAENRAP